MQPVPAFFQLKKGRPVRRSRVFVWIALFALGIVAFGTSKAEATCGDYLSHHGYASHRGMVDHQRSLPGEHPMEGHPARTPCHGPSCQQGPMQAPLSPPVISLETQDRWGWMASVVIPVLDPDSFLSQFNESSALPMIAYRLDRPPKV